MTTQTDAQAFKPEDYHFLVNAMNELILGYQHPENVDGNWLSARVINGKPQYRIDNLPQALLKEAKQEALNSPIPSLQAMMCVSEATKHQPIISGYLDAVCSVKCTAKTLINQQHISKVIAPDGSEHTLKLSAMGMCVAYGTAETLRYFIAKGGNLKIKDSHLVAPLAEQSEKAYDVFSTSLITTALLYNNWSTAIVLAEQSSKRISKLLEASEDETRAELIDRSEQVKEAILTYLRSTTRKVFKLEFLDEELCFDFWNDVEQDIRLALIHYTNKMTLDYQFKPEVIL